MMSKRCCTALLFVSTALWSHASLAVNFNVYEIDSMHKKEMVTCGSYRNGCPVSPERLRRVVFSYYDFDGHEHDDGELIVMDAVANNVIKIFKELYGMKFPIYKAKRIEAYKANDTLSLEANNSAAFNCRKVVGKSSLPSIHSYGLAIDINPWQNPYVGFDEENGKLKTEILPFQGANYINRSNMRDGMAEAVVDIFKKNGFTIWGGKWNTPIDWQHFQTTRAVAEVLAKMDKDDSIEFFTYYVDNHDVVDKVLSVSKETFIKSYDQYKSLLIKSMKEHLSSFSLETDSSLIVEKLINRITK